jgi:hypothetical protein
MIEAAYQSKQPTLVKNPDGSWSGILVTLVALPAFAFALTIFPALWGRGVIELWQMLIRKLPHPIWQAYRPYSQVPKLLLYSFSITLVAIALGKFVSPGSPAPESTRILLLNTFGDALSILLAGYAFRRIQYRRRFFSRARRLAQTFVVLSTLIVALSVASIVALWGGVYGTPQAVSLEAAAHILVAKPYHDLTFATPVELQGHATTVGDFYIKALNESVAKGETKPDVGFWIVVMVASNTGRINLIDDWVSRYSMRDPDNRLPEIKRFASQKFHSADGIGPYFWIMHTTFMPILILSLVALLHSVSLFIRKPVAYVFAAAGKVERPNNLIVVTCGAISAFFVLAARLLTW